MNRRGLVILAVVAALLLAPLYAVAAGTILANIERISFTDSLGNQTGDVIHLQGIAGNPDVANPHGLQVSSTRNDRGAFIQLLWRGPLPQDSDAAFIAYGYGDGPGMFVAGPHTYFKCGGNAGADGKIAYYYCGNFVEGGAEGRNFRLLSGGRPFIVGLPDGWAEVYTGIRAVDGAGRPTVEMAQNGLSVRKPDGTMGLVELGPPDSESTGYRALRTPN